MLKKLLLIILFMLYINIAYAYTIENLADAIFRAENSKSHPYGILQHYKTTTPRQACINTIKHAIKDWNGQGDFIVFLGNRYCPPNAHPLNKNWVRNVKYFLLKEVNEK